MSNNSPEKPIEELLDEVEKRKAYQYGTMVSLTVAERDRLVYELRQRIEREQATDDEQGQAQLIVDRLRNDSTCQCTSCQRREAEGLAAILKLVADSRQQIEKEKQSDVEAALIELREMSPEPHLGRVFVTQKFCYSTEDNGAFEVWNIEGRIFGDSPFVGRTLEEAMQEIRQWKEESK